MPWIAQNITTFDRESILNVMNKWKAHQFGWPFETDFVLALKADASRLEINGQTLLKEYVEEALSNSSSDECSLFLSDLIEKLLEREKEGEAWKTSITSIKEGINAAQNDLEKLGNNVYTTLIGMYNQAIKGEFDPINPNNFSNLLQNQDHAKFITFASNIETWGNTLEKVKKTAMILFGTNNWKEIRKKRKDLVVFYHPDRVVQSQLPKPLATKMYKAIDTVYDKIEAHLKKIAL